MNEAEAASGREIKRSARSSPSGRLEASIALFTAHTVRNPVCNGIDALRSALKNSVELLLGNTKYSPV